MTDGCAGCMGSRTTHALQARRAALVGGGGADRMRPRAGMATNGHGCGSIHSNGRSCSCCVRQEQYAGFAAIASRSNGSGWSSCRLIQGMIPERLWPEREKRGLILSDGSDSSGSGRDMSSCVWSGFGMSGYVGVAVPGDGSDSVLRLEIYWL